MTENPDTPLAALAAGAAPGRQHYRQLALQVMRRCEDLAAISSMDIGVCRHYLTAEHQRCNRAVAAWMEEAGMHCWQDNAGNLWGRFSANRYDAPVLVIGSHLDTVPNGGKYDGILGVLLPIAVLDLVGRVGLSLPFHVDVVGFGDEEGSRFGATLMGSRAVAGRWRDEWLELTDSRGISLAAALEEFGCDTGAVAAASRVDDRLLAFLEVHIEQGPLLEQAAQPLGVVTGIAGARRFVVNIRGRAGHAGTVPMELRQDALVAAANAVQMVESVARRFQIVATVGELQCFPGAPNVIPGDCRLTVDIRSGRDQARDLAIDALREEIGRMVAERSLAVDWHETHSAPAVLCSSELQRLLEDVLLDMDLTPVSLVSGAGHDAMSFDGVTDIGMLFVRCAGGISHHPDESIDAGDVAAAAEALYRSLVKIAEQHRQGHSP